MVFDLGPFDRYTFPISYVAGGGRLFLSVGANVYSQPLQRVKTVPVCSSSVFIIMIPNDHRAMDQ